MIAYKICSIYDNKFYNLNYKAPCIDFNDPVSYNINTLTYKKFFSVGLFAFRDREIAYKYIKAYLGRKTGEARIIYPKTNWILFECEVVPVKNNILQRIINNIIDIMHDDTHSCTPVMYISPFTKGWINDNTIFCKYIKPIRKIIDGDMYYKLNNAL